MVFLGPSGSGKTTLLKLINRLFEPDTGTIFIDGKNILDTKKEALRRKMGYVIQHTGLLPHLTVQKNIELVGKVVGQQVPPPKINELLSLIGLAEDVLPKYPRELSGGQQQRIGIARALATEPSIVLMDEPFSALDNVTRGQLQDDFLTLKHLENKTILMVTHDIPEAFKLGDRIVLLHDGAIQQVGPPLTLLNNPANQMVSDFLNKDRFILGLESYKYNN
ncbi:MAG: ATP-binding cassette domain-containing protein, partial [Bacteroidota bacterium]